MCQVLELCLLINVSYVPRVSSMPFNTMAVRCQVWTVCLSIQCQSCAKCDCQYVSHVPSVSSMTVNTMSVMCQVWAVWLSIQRQSCAKCEQYDCQYNVSCATCEQYAHQYNGSHVPSVSSMPVIHARAPPFKIKAWMCPKHTECLDSTFQSLNKFIT
jgi:hypothetical protein